MTEIRDGEDETGISVKKQEKECQRKYEGEL